MADEPGMRVAAALTAPLAQKFGWVTTSTSGRLSRILSAKQQREVLGNEQFIALRCAGGYPATYSRTQM
jgi:hypothetical protein